MLKKVFVIAVLAAGIAAAVAYWVHDETLRRAHQAMGLEQPSFMVEPGDTVSDVLGKLADAGLAQDRRWLGWYARLTEQAHRLHVGEFALSRGDSWAAFLERLTTGKVLMRQWTIVPGWTVREMLESLSHLPLAHTPGLAVDSLPTLLDLPAGYSEGWFLPDTYAYVKGERDLRLLSRAHSAMLRALDAAWRERNPDLPLEDTTQLLIMASIIEKETGHPDDRELVSSVFSRRLEIGMRLQTDPTVIYGLGEAFDGNLTRKHLRTPGPFNTYMNHGLPPTPIALPGRAALRAAVNPADADYLYFVARGDGTSQFSRTLDEHVAAVRRYQLRR